MRDLKGKTFIIRFTWVLLLPGKEKRKKIKKETHRDTLKSSESLAVTGDLLRGKS